jgi:hypothetical protein
LMRSQNGVFSDSAPLDIAWFFNRSACAIVPQKPLSSTPVLAGEEGFEPPHPVLETGGLPLNLLP